MKFNFTEEEYQKTKSNEKLSLICFGCNEIFFKRKGYISSAIKHKGHSVECGKYCKQYASSCCFCSNKCHDKFKITKLELNCDQCKKHFLKTKSQYEKTKNNFCSRSCAATYNNTHKTTGTRRSKLEVWLEQKLPEKYPNIEFLFNDKTTINSELDIFLPKLNLAFELNGIFHYEPIYGKDKLSQIKNNDNRKFQACLEKQIELCIIDVSKLTYFKEKTANEFLEIISKIIENYRV